NSPVKFSPTMKSTFISSPTLNLNAFGSSQNSCALARDATNEIARKTSTFRFITFLFTIHQLFYFICLNRNISSQVKHTLSLHHHIILQSYAKPFFLDVYPRLNCPNRIDGHFIVHVAHIMNVKPQHVRSAMIIKTAERFLPGFL